MAPANGPQIVVSRNCSVGRVQKCAWAPHPRLLLNLLKRIKYSYPAGVKRKNERTPTFRLLFTLGSSRTSLPTARCRQGAEQNYANARLTPAITLSTRSAAQPYQRPFLLSFCFTRAFTSLLISAVGNGLSVENCMVPLDVTKPFSSSLNASITDAVGNKLQCFENAAYHTSTRLCLNARIP